MISYLVGFLSDGQSAADFSGTASVNDPIVANLNKTNIKIKHFKQLKMVAIYDNQWYAINKFYLGWEVWNQTTQTAQNEKPSAQRYRPSYCPGP